MTAETQQPGGDEYLGKSVGPYQVESVLGVGGMGRVYSAVGPDGERVALKLVKRDLASDDIFRRRFEREVRIAQSVKHKHVVPVLDSGTHEGIPYMAQKFVAGGTLEDRLKKESPIDLRASVKICAQVADGLDALSEAGLVHRDVKPANILFDEDGTAYITDFGLAKDSQGSVLTRPGQALGSVDYMAPEQIRTGDVLPASDVYALACVMYECLSGAPPFADRQGMRVLRAHLQDEPAHLSSRRTDLPRDVGDMIAKALDKEPENRPRTAGTFSRLLQAASASAARAPADG
jgi:serine/threonine-protein kinase